MCTIVTFWLKAIYLKNDKKNGRSNLYTTIVEFVEICRA